MSFMRSSVVSDAPFKARMMPKARSASIFQRKRGGQNYKGWYVLCVSCHKFVVWKAKRIPILGWSRVPKVNWVPGFSGRRPHEVKQRWAWVARTWTSPEKKRWQGPWTTIDLLWC